ncbi:MAG: HNH endonuclease [Pirellulales bacterium]
MNPLERFQFRCPECKVNVVARNRVRGETKQCPGCGAPIVVPGVYLPDPPPVDPNAVRSLDFVARRAASLIQEVINKDHRAAMLINGIFVYLPKQHELEGLPLDQTDKVWQICVEVNRILDFYGAHHRQVWKECMERIPILGGRSSATSNRVQTPRRKWSIAVRREVWSHYGRKCFYCAVPLTSWQGEFMHLDHLRPLAGGGEDDEENLVPACPDCNLEKGKQEFPELGD